MHDVCYPDIHSMRCSGCGALYWPARDDRLSCRWQRMSPAQRARWLGREWVLVFALGQALALLALIPLYAVGRLLGTCWGVVQSVAGDFYRIYCRAVALWRIS